MTPAEQAKIDRAYLWSVSNTPQEQAVAYSTRLGLLDDETIASIANYVRSTGDAGPAKTLQPVRTGTVSRAPGPGLASSGGQAMFDEARRMATAQERRPTAMSEGQVGELASTLLRPPIATPTAAPEPSPAPQTREAFVAERMQQLSEPGGSLAAAREAYANAQWAAQNYDPTNDYQGDLLKLITNNLNYTADNLRQQEQADRPRAGGGAAGPSPQALALIEMQTRQAEAELTGQYQGQPTFAAQQAQQGIAEREQTRQEALQARREAYFKSQWDQLMGSGQHFAPAGANYAGSDIPGVAAPSSGLMNLAYGGEIPRGYGPPGPNMLSGLAGPTQGG